MGQLDWAVHHKPAPHTIQSFRYSVALGEELLARIEASEDRVSVFWVIHVDKPLTLSAEQSSREGVYGNQEGYEYYPGEGRADDRNPRGPHNNIKGDE